MTKLVAFSKSVSIVLYFILDIVCTIYSLYTIFHNKNYHYGITLWILSEIASIKVYTIGKDLAEGVEKGLE